MPKDTYATCRECGRHRNETGILSRSRLCMDCAQALERRNALGIAAKTGPEFRRWRRAMAACVGGVLVSDLDTMTSSGNSQP